MRRPWPALLAAFAQFLILLPAFLFLWYFAGDALFPALAKLLEPVLRTLWPDTVLSVQPSGRKILILTQLLPPDHVDPVMRPPRRAVMVNPFTYSYGLPLFAALALASSAGWRSHLLRLAIGLPVLILGLIFSVIVSLLYLFQISDGYAGLRVVESAELNEAVVFYAHFLGFNLTPRLLPLLLWVLLYRDWLGELARDFRRVRA